MRTNAFFLTFNLVMLLTISANGQSEQGDQEIAGGIGYRTGADVFYAASYKRKGDPKYQPGAAYCVSYKYFFHDNVAVGLSITEHSYTTVQLDDYYNEISRTNNGYCTVDAEFKFVYRGASTEFFQMYGAYGLGYTFMYKGNFSNRNQGLALYIAPVCFRFGGRHAAFLEFGLGYKGLINGGYSFRIPTRGKRMWHRK
jgi:hypothetical protein